MFSQTLRNYRNLNCPLSIQYGARTDMIQGVKFINEIFSLVALNKHQRFFLYKQLVDLLKDNFVKGAYCLSQLASMDEENIRYDAFNALFSFLTCEQSEIARLKVFTPISSFLKHRQFGEEQKVKALLITEIVELHRLFKNTYDKTSLFFPSLIYNERFETNGIFLNYDVNHNQKDITFINSYLNRT